MATGIKGQIQKLLLTKRTNEYSRELKNAEIAYDDYVRKTEEGRLALSQSELTYAYVTVEELVEIGMDGLAAHVGCINRQGADLNEHIMEIGIPDVYIVHLGSGLIATDGISNILEYFEKNPDKALVYGDEDCFAGSRDEYEEYKRSSIPASRRFYPYNKSVPAFESFMSKQYFGCLIAFRSELLQNGEDKKYGQILFNQGFSSGTSINKQMADKAFYLFILYNWDKGIGNVDKVLYHRFVEMDKTELALIRDGKKFEKLVKLHPEIDEVSGADADMAAVKDKYMSIHQIPGHMEEKNEYFVPVFDVPVLEDGSKPRVSIIIPSKDNVEVLKNCLSSIRVHTSYRNFEVIVVDNGSNDENRSLLEIYIENLKSTGFAIEYIYDKADFNYSYMNNVGVKASTGDYICLLNDDVEVLDPRWMEIMLGQASLEGVGAVGAKLLYPETGKIQHIGIINTTSEPVHVCLGKDDDKVYYHGRNRLVLNCMAVTGACLMVSREKYDQLGGLYEGLPVAYNDVDFCFSLLDRGYRNVIRNDVVMIHHESVSRGKDAADAAKMERLKEERRRLYLRHTNLFGADPYEGNLNLGGVDTGFDIDTDYRSRNSTHVKPVKITDEYRHLPAIMHVSLEKCDKEVAMRIDGGNVYSIKGYALVPGIDNMRFTYKLVLENGETKYQMPIKGQLRLDLDTIFPDTPNTKLAGFHNYIIQGEVEPGLYEICILGIDHGNRSRVLYQPTGRTITIE